MQAPLGDLEEAGQLPGAVQGGDPGRSRAAEDGRSRAGQDRRDARARDPTSPGRRRLVARHRHVADPDAGHVGDRVCLAGLQVADPEAVPAQRRLSHTGEPIGSPQWRSRSRSSGRTTTGCTSPTRRSGWASGRRRWRCPRGPRRSATHSSAPEPRWLPQPAMTTRQLEAVHDGELLAFLASAWQEWEAAGLPDDPGQNRVVPYIFPHPGLLGGARAARARRDVGAAGSVLLRHDDADRAGHLGGRAGRCRRGHDRRRPRLQGPERRLCVLPPSRPPRHAYRLRRLLLSEQRCDRGRASPRQRRRTGRHRRRRRPSRERRPADLLGARTTSSQGRCTSTRKPAGFPTSSARRPSVAAECGLGANLNVPLPPGAGDAEWLHAVAEVAAGRPGQRCRGHRAGARASMRRAATPRAHSTSPARAFGRQGASSGARGCRCVVVQEGGYDLGSIGGLVLATLEGLEEGVLPMPEPLDGLGREGRGRGCPLAAPQGPEAAAALAARGGRRDRAAPFAHARRRRAHGGLHPGSRHLRRVVARARRRRDLCRAAAADDGSRADAVLGGHGAAALARRHRWSPTPTRGTSGSWQRRVGRHESSSRPGARSGSGTTASSSPSSVTTPPAWPSWTSPIPGRDHFVALSHKGRTWPQARSSATATSGERPCRRTAGLWRSSSLRGTTCSAARSGSPTSRPVRRER